MMQAAKKVFETELFHNKNLDRMRRINKLKNKQYVINESSTKRFPHYYINFNVA